jgi:hypothetical protein
MSEQRLTHLFRTEQQAVSTNRPVERRRVTRDSNRRISGGRLHSGTTAQCLVLGARSRAVDFIAEPEREAKFEAKCGGVDGVQTCSRVKPRVQVYIRRKT